MASPPAARFLPLADVAEILSISMSQAYALVRRGDLRAIRIGGRGQWRVEKSELEAFIKRSYAAEEDELGTTGSHHTAADDELAGHDNPDHEEQPSPE